MQWNDGANAGFTTGTPWMAVNPNYKTVNAKAQLRDPDSVFSFYQRLIRLRREMPVITEGDFTLLMEEDEQVFAYLRSDGKQTLQVACNFSGVCAALDEQAKTQGEMLLGNYSDEGRADKLRPWEVRVTLM